MAVLSGDQIKKFLEGTRGHTATEKKSCDEHDKRVRFHCEAAMNATPQQYRATYLGWVGSMIAAGKLAVFQNLLVNPVPTIEFTEGLFDEFTKVFEAQDKHFEARFTNPKLTADFEDYLTEIGDPTYWATKGFETMKTAINSVVIVDLPAIPGDGFARPYYYTIDISKVFDMEVDDRYRVEWIAFYNRYTDDIIHVFDDMFLRTYVKNKVGSWEQTSEVTHDLGYTPARSFWTTPFQNGSRIQKKGPQSSALTDLDWLLFIKTSLKHVELYAGFPIDVVYESRCDYKDAEGHNCDGGFIKYQKEMMVTNAAGYMESSYIPMSTTCPKCLGGTNKSLGAGQLIEAPARASNDDPDMLQGMNRISADVESMKHLMERVNQIESDTATNMVGYIPEFMRQAMNTNQVASNLESQKNCLIQVADNFEAIDKFVKETLARFRYGPDAVIEVVVNYGRKWYLQSAEQQQSEYKESKTNGLANFELSSQFEQFLSTKYKNNPTMLSRMRTLYAIEPYQNYTLEEVLNMNDKLGLNEELLRLKVDFGQYVARFEREFTNIGEFMSGMSFELKVAFIQEKLLEYVAEDYPEEAIPPAPPAFPAPAADAPAAA